MTDTLSTAEKTTRTSAAAPVGLEPPTTSGADQPLQANEIVFSKNLGQLKSSTSENVIDRLATKIREKSPDWLVNSGTQVNFAFKASADTMSIWSSIRRGSASSWRFAGSAVTLAAELLGTVYKEKRISEERQKAYDAMSLPKYIGAKTLESCNPKEHILETVGLATIVNGVCTAISGLTQSSKKKVSWEIAQGALTAVAGIIMNYMPDRERAWQLSTAIFWTRAPVAGKQAWEAYFHGYPDRGIIKGDWQQAAKWGLNQSSNLFGFFYGGVKKLPDGTIVHIGKKGDDTSPRGKQHLLSNGENTLPKQQVPEMTIQQTKEAQVEHTPPQQNAALAKA